MKPMQWSDISYFAGLDWANEKHQVVVIDADGRIVEEICCQHSAAGWQQLRERFAAYPQIAVCVESGLALVLEQLLLMHVCVYSLTGRSAAAFRTRKAPSGIKSDHLDAWSLADALRTDGHGWHPIEPADEPTKELRLMCRDQVALIEQRTALLNQLQAALREYYPTAIAAFADWRMVSAWAFIERFPTSEALAKAGQRNWEKFLHLHRLARPDQYQQRLAIFAAATTLKANEGAAAAKSLLALSIIKLLRCIDAQIAVYGERIEHAFTSHPLHKVFASLPGAGPKLGPRLLAEICTCRNAYPDARALQCHAGTAPVSYQSGKMHKVRVRHACNKHLRAAVHLWAFQSQKRCTWASVYYRALRERGKNHACALRVLGNRWLKIVWKMCQTCKPYDGELHSRNQLKHGSWLLKLEAA